MQPELPLKIHSTPFGEGDSLDFVFFLEPAYLNKLTEEEKIEALKTIESYQIDLYIASKEDWMHLEQQPIGAMINDFWLEYLQEGIEGLNEAVSKYILTTTHVYFRIIYRLKTEKIPSRPSKMLEQELDNIARKISSPFVGDKVLSMAVKSGALYTYKTFLDNYLEETGKDISNRNITPERLFSVFDRYINDEKIIDEIFRSGLMDTLKNLGKEISTQISSEMDVFLDKYLKIRKSNYRDTQKKIMSIENGTVMSSRIFAMIWEAITKTPDWGSNEHTRSDLGITNEHYILNDKRGNIEAAFYLGGDSETERGLVSLSTDPQTTSALQRWSIEHLRLYFAINFAISNSSTGQAELTEADLMHAAGYTKSITNGNSDKSEAKRHILNALNDLKLLHMHLVTKDQKFKTGHFPIYQIEPLPIFYNGPSSEVLGIRARVSLGLWARDFVSVRDGPNYNISQQFFDISSKREPLSLLLAVWISLNQYRIKSNKTLSIKDVLKEVLPESIQPEGLAYSFSWEELYSAHEGALTSRARDRRHKLRQDFKQAQVTLAGLNIILETTTKIRRECTWEDFLNTRVYLKESQSKSIEHVNVDIVRIKKKLKSQRITQAELAEVLNVSQSQVSKWLGGKVPMPKAIFEKIEEYADSERT